MTFFLMDMVHQYPNTTWNVNVTLRKTKKTHVKNIETKITSIFEFFF